MDGVTTSEYASGVAGINNGTGVGVYGTGGLGSIRTGGPGVLGFGGNYGGTNDGTGGYFAGGIGTVDGDGIRAVAGRGFAGIFHGDIAVTGTLSANTKYFKVDHPLDPANKYLYHASAESSEMMNIYTGNVTTDAKGEATVQLPEWFEVLNTDFRYPLTAIGAPGPGLYMPRKLQVTNSRSLEARQIPKFPGRSQVCARMLTPRRTH